MPRATDSDSLSDLARVRRVLARELETINEYEAYAREAESPELRAFFEHLASEEKEHVAEATHMLRLLDAGQEAQFGKPVRREHFGAGQAPDPAVSAPPPPTLSPPHRLLYGAHAPPAPSGSPLTVGPLKRGAR